MSCAIIFFKLKKKKKKKKKKNRKWCMYMCVYVYNIGKKVLKLQCSNNKYVRVSSIVNSTIYFTTHRCHCEHCIITTD